MRSFIDAPVAAEYGLEILHARLGKLEAHDAGDRAADDPGADREQQVEGADILVVGRHEPADEEAGLVVGVMMVMRPGGLELAGVCSGVGHGAGFRPSQFFVAAWAEVAGVAEASTAAGGAGLVSVAAAPAVGAASA